MPATEPESIPVVERWHKLLMAEMRALDALRPIPARLAVHSMLDLYSIIGVERRTSTGDDMGSFYGLAVIEDETLAPYTWESRARDGRPIARGLLPCPFLFYRVGDAIST